MEKQALYIDPRTKLFLLLVMNIVMLDTSSGVLLPYLIKFRKFKINID